MSLAPPLAPVDAATEQDGYVCSCLQITACQLLATLAGNNVRTLRELRQIIGAGDGCTACHPILIRYLSAHNHGG